VTDPAAGVVAMVMVAVVVGALLIVVVMIVLLLLLLLLQVVLLLLVLMVVVMVVMVTAVVFLSTLDVLQLQVHHVMLSGTGAASARAVVDDLVAIQILVAEPVTTKRLGGQVVPRLDRLDGAVVTPVRRRRLRLD